MSAPYPLFPASAYTYALPLCQCLTISTHTSTRTVALHHYLTHSLIPLAAQQLTASPSIFLCLLCEHKCDRLRPSAPESPGAATHTRQPLHSTSQLPRAAQHLGPGGGGSGASDVGARVQPTAARAPRRGVLAAASLGGAPPLLAIIRSCGCAKFVCRCKAILILLFSYHSLIFSQSRATALSECVDFPPFCIAVLMWAATHTVSSTRTIHTTDKNKTCWTSTERQARQLVAGVCLLTTTEARSNLFVLFSPQKNVSVGNTVMVGGKAH